MALEGRGTPLVRFGAVFAHGISGPTLVPIGELCIAINVQMVESDPPMRPLALVPSKPTIWGALDVEPSGPRLLPTSQSVSLPLNRREDVTR